MGFNTYPNNPFPPSTDQMDADALEAEVSKLNSDVSELKSGLTNYENQNNLNLDVPNRKNVLPMTVETIKSANTAGTWNGNTYSINGLTYTIEVDTNGKVSSITTYGSKTDTSATSRLLIATDLNASDYVGMLLNGCPNIGGENYGEIYVQAIGGSYSVIADDYGDTTGVVIGSTSASKVRVGITVGNSFNVDVANAVTFYPMIRPATITDPTFAPYIPSVESRIEAVESDSVKLFENICSGVKIKQGYKGYDADVITFDSGYYIFIAVKPLYGNSAIYAIDGSSTPQLLGGKDLSITQTVNNSRISLSFVGNYMQFMLVRLNTKADFTDEIHLTVATP